jgi:two-component system cell cycle response regulator DivK
MPKRILVVEDDVLNSVLLCTVLATTGFSVEAVRDGAKVIERAKQFAPDLITMDINLPNISGLDLICKLRADASLARIPVLALTAYVGKGDEALIRRAGATDFFAKPISIRPFVTAVQELLRKAASAPTSSAKVELPLLLDKGQ